MWELERVGWCPEPTAVRARCAECEYVNFCALLHCLIRRLGGTIFGEDWPIGRVYEQNANRRLFGLYNREKAAQNEGVMERSRARSPLRRGLKRSGAGPAGAGGGRRTRASFTGAAEPYEKLKRALRAEVDEAAWASRYSTTSRPFARPTTGRIAVKVINHYGDEVLKVFPV